MARGIVALRDGDRAAAVAHLKASTDGVDANVVVEDFLWSRLTNYLLAAGERETVAQFFDTLSRGSTDAQRFANSAKAIRVWERDEEVDEMYTSLFRELLTYMMEDPRSITPCTHLLFIAKNVERVHQISP